MSLSAWEQDALDSIKDRLASSDPTLVARLTIFARLASNEAMPAREEIRASPRRDVRHSHPEAGHTRRVYQRLGLQQAALLLWLVTTVALIAVVLVYNRGRQPSHMHGTLGNDLRSCGIGRFGSGHSLNGPQGSVHSSPS